MIEQAKALRDAIQQGEAEQLPEFPVIQPVTEKVAVFAAAKWQRELDELNSK